MKKLLLSFFTLFFILFTLQGQLEKINKALTIKYPKVSFDGSKMIFIANIYGSYQPFVSDYDPDSAIWKTPYPILKDVLEGFEIKDPQFNHDNTKIYFAGKTAEKPDFDIYFSELKDGAWTVPDLLPIDIHSGQDELGPALSANEKKMLFIRPLPPEEKSDEHCGQLYYTEFTEAGEWSEPELLPPSYNTGCICSPYYSKDNQTFYYASFEEISDSQGKRIAKNQFSIMWARIDGWFRYKPKAITSIIDKQDLAYPSFANDSILYFGAGVYSKGENKIESTVRSYTIESEFRTSSMTLLSGYVKNENQEPLSASIQIIDPYTTKVYQKVTSNSEGYYQSFVPANGQFSLLASKSGFSAQSKLVVTEKTALMNDFELFPEVEVTFNVFDQEFYFPVDNISINLSDADFNPLMEIELERGERTNLKLGKELNIIFQSENYFPDTLNLPFGEEVIYDFFSFDIELVRKLKDVDLAFTDSEGNNLALEVTVFNVTRNEKTKRKVKDGKINLSLRDGEVYEISTSAEGYSYYSEQLDLSDKKTQVAIQAELKSVKNTSLVLNNIIFAKNSYELNAESYDELNKLVDYLAENDQYRVEVSAHTDDAGGETYNLKLSNLRANSVLEYLQDHSVSKDRLVSKGYGESQPIFPNDTDENRAKNRRVAFKILTD